MMLKEFTSRSRHFQTEQKSNKKSQKIFEQCQKVIKELQTQLQYALQKNQQKDQIIKLLTEQKQYYEQQSRKSDENIYPKLKEQLSFNQSLINGLKQHNKELTEKNLMLEEENKDIWDRCSQKDEILKITQENIIKLKQQKSQLQREWGETLKCVKKKIFQIQQENNCYDKLVLEKEMNKKRALSKPGEKKNQAKNEQKRKNSINLAFKEKSDQKVNEILKEIDNKLLNYDFLQLIQSKELRKEIRAYDTSESNKQNICQNFMIGKFDKNELKSKKVPFLKLSELKLREE